jgi:hypothetical protein
MLTEKEAQQQIPELKRTIIPELLPHKLRSLNIGYPSDEDNALNKALNSDNSGLELTKLIAGRAQKVLEAGCKLTINNNGAESPTELLAIFQNLEALSKNLKLFSNMEANFERINWNLFENIVSISIMLGYQTGSHDMRENVERHANNGYKDRVTSPKKGGDNKAHKYKTVKELVLAMATFILENTNVGKTSNSAISKAIEVIIKEFSDQGNNNNIEALTKFSARCPAKRTINDWINSSGQIKSPLNSLKKPNHSKLLEVLKNEFPANSILSTLNNK